MAEMKGQGGVERKSREDEATEKKGGEEHAQITPKLAEMIESCRKQGKLLEAMDMYEKGLAECIDSFGSRSLEVAEMYSSLAAFCKSQGKLKPALDFFMKALFLRRDRHGAIHRSVAESCSGAASCYYLLGKVEKATELYEKSEEIYLKCDIKGQSSDCVRLDFAMTLFLLARCYRTKHRFNDALELNQKTLAIRLALLGDSHQLTAASYSNVAVSYVDVGRVAEALEMLKKALEIRMTFGPEHPTLHCTYALMASCYKKLNEEKDAKRCMELALQLR